MTDVDTFDNRRVAAIAGLTFSGLFLIHHLLQGFGPADSSVHAVAAYNVSHRGAMLASEIALGLALLAVIAFLAPLTVVVWRAGRPTVAVAVAASGSVFVAMGFLSAAAETALVGAAADGQAAAVDALNQLQGRTPVVWASAALTASIYLAARHDGLMARWLGVATGVLAVVFLLAGMSSFVGRSVEGPYSLIGVGLFIVWMVAVSVSLLRGNHNVAPSAPTAPAAPSTPAATTVTP
jgi:hypothetical protein